MNRTLNLPSSFHLLKHPSAVPVGQGRVKAMYGGKHPRVLRQGFCVMDVGLGIGE